MSEKVEATVAKKRTKEFTILVNAVEMEVDGPNIGFEALTRLAFPNAPTGPHIEFTVTYRRGHGDKPSGSLTSGQSVRIKEGMIFDVTLTDRS